MLGAGLVLILAPDAAAQGYAAEKPDPAPRVDLKIAFWYDRARPLDTLKHQVYDVRKGEYTPAVDVWLALMKKDHPGYDAYVRDIDLAHFRGANDNLKTGDAIITEFLLVAGVNGVDLISPPRMSAGARPAAPARSLLPRSSAPLDFVPGPGSSPFPVPFPRPHP